MTSFDPRPRYETMPSVIRTPVAGFLAWLVPGLGHLYLGDRGRGFVCMAAIIATFWTGVAIGGVGTTIDPTERTLWFTAQMCTGANAVAGYAMHRGVVSKWSPEERAKALSRWTSTEVGVHYTGVAGLLNLLVILDAMARSENLPARSSVKRRDELRVAT